MINEGARASPLPGQGVKERQRNKHGLVQKGAMPAGAEFYGVKYPSPVSVNAPVARSDDA